MVWPDIGTVRASGHNNKGTESVIGRKHTQPTHVPREKDMMSAGQKMVIASCSSSAIYPLARRDVQRYETSG